MNKLCEIIASICYLNIYNIYESFPICGNLLIIIYMGNNISVTII